VYKAAKQVESSTGEEEKLDSLTCKPHVGEISGQ